MSYFILYLLLMVSCCQFSLYSMNARRCVDIVMGAVACPWDVHVYMNHSNVLTSGEKKKRISTLGLRGCIVNVVYMKNDDMDQQVIMTHWHPYFLEEHGIELSRQLDKVSLGKYNYLHNITIYQNGYSFIKRDAKEALFLQKNLPDKLVAEVNNSYRTYEHLRSIVEKKVNIQQLHTSFVPYIIRPVMPNGIPLASEVYVTLSQDSTNPSLCQIIDTYDRKLYCDNNLNTEIPMFSKSKRERDALIAVCYNKNE